MLSKIATFIIRKRFYLSINGLFMNKELNLAHRYFKRCHNSFTLFSYHHRRNNSRSWLVLMGAACLSHGFLGFTFGQHLEDEEEKDPLKEAFNEARKVQYKQDFENAEVLYHKALKVADELFRLKKIDEIKYIDGRILIFDGLAGVALAIGELEKAENLYKETLKGCLQRGMEMDHNVVVGISLNVASIYAMLERRDEAEKGMLFCINCQDAKLVSKEECLGCNDTGIGGHEDSDLDIVSSDYSVQPEQVTDAENSLRVETEVGTGEEKLGLDDPHGIKLELREKIEDTKALLGMALESYGRLLLGGRRLEEAVTVLERAVQVGEGVLGESADQQLVLLNDLATVYILKKNFRQASLLLKKAITFGMISDSPVMPALYSNLGAVFLRTNELDQAERSCIKAQDMSYGISDAVGHMMAKQCLDKIAQVRHKNMKS